MAAPDPVQVLAIRGVIGLLVLFTVGAILVTIIKPEAANQITDPVSIVAVFCIPVGVLTWFRWRFIKV
jgi:hypothetical protein